MRKILHLLVILVLALPSNGQDPASFLFGQHGSLYNPALAGTGGSQSLSLAYRQEWINANDAGYQTILLAYDESMPCSVLDFGINALWDREGSGLLTSYEISPKVSVSLPLIVTTRHQLNVRLGGGVSIGHQEINFGRLIFSDQLDPKYGNIFPTTFSLPDENANGNYLQPGIGILLQTAFNKLKRNAILFNAGVSFHNSYALGNNSKVGYGKSILGLLPPQSPKWSAHMDVEVMPGISSGYISIKPAFLFEKQEGLYYMQYGLDFGMTNALRIGGYFHQQNPGNSNNTNWFSLSTLFRPYIGGNRLDLYLAYSFNISGLKHEVTPLFEIGIKKHFKNSFTCGLMGKEDSYSHNKFKCPWFSISPAKKKLYGNVWY